MADPKIRIKRSAVAGRIPSVNQVPLGELALNTWDGQLYASKNVGLGTTVVAINPWLVGTGTNTYNAYFTAGNIGIGITVPTSTLHVSGDGLFTSTLTATSASFSDNVYIDGYVGINSTTPNVPLDVNGDASISGYLGVDGILYKGQTPIYFDENSLGLVQIVGSGSNLKFYNPVFGPGGDWIFDTYSYGEVVRITNSGNVGIGSTTPTSKLHVVGDAYISGVVTANAGFNLGISSAGSVITSGPIKTLNFIGAGNTFLVNGTTVDISIQGGGGGAEIGVQANDSVIGYAQTTLNFAGTGVTGVSIGTTTTITIEPGLVGAAKSVTSFTATAGQTTFNVNYSAGQENVFLNGVRLSESQYTATNGTTIVLSEPAAAGDSVDIVVYLRGADPNRNVGVTLLPPFNGITTAFTMYKGTTSYLFDPIDERQIVVSLGGVIQQPGVAYTVGTGSSIFFSAAPGAATTCFITALYSNTVGVPTDAVKLNKQTYTPSGIQTTFTVTEGYSSGYLDVYRNGIRLVDGSDFTASNGTTFDLVTPATGGDVVDIIAYKTLNIQYAEFAGLSTNVDGGYGSLTNLQVSGISTLGNVLIGVGGTDLLVKGNARVTGILSIGQGTITFNGNNNTISGLTTVYATSFNDGPLSGFRNRVINGDMRIDQRNAGVSTTALTFLYTLDRWIVSEGTDGVATVQRSGTAPVGFTSSLLYTVTTADASIAAGQYALVYTYMEGYTVADLSWGTSDAKPITISFWVRCSLTGTFAVNLRNNGIDRSYVSTYTINSANTWEYKSITIPGDTTGTWEKTNSLGIALFFSLGMGSTFEAPSSNTWYGANYHSVSGTVNVMGTLNATWHLTGVQVESGTVATPFERRPFDVELNLCRRYYEKSYEVNTKPAQGTGSNGYYNGIAISAGSLRATFIPYKVTKRTTTPTLTFYNDNNLNATAGRWAYFAGSWVESTSTSADTSNQDGFGVILGASGLTGGNAYLIAGAWTSVDEM